MSTPTSGYLHTDWSTADARHPWGSQGRVSDLIKKAVMEDRALITMATCRKCASQAHEGKVRCGYCNLEFEYIVKRQPATTVQLCDIKQIPLS